MPNKSIIELPSLQAVHSQEEFFEALEKADLTKLEEILSGAEPVDPYGGKALIPNPQAACARRGPKPYEPGPFVKLWLFYRYPGTKSPPNVHALHQELRKKGGATLARQCGFPGRIPDRRIIRERFEKLEKHPGRIKEALVAISAMIPVVIPTEGLQPYLMPPDPPPVQLQDERTAPSRTGEKNAHQVRLEDEAMGDNFDLWFGTQNKREDFLLKYLHGGVLGCHHCIQECTLCDGYQVDEYPVRDPVCSNPDEHVQHREHEPRRQWRCLCCRRKLSVTSGTLLHGVKLPLRTVLLCLYHMVEERYGVNSAKLSRKLKRGLKKAGRRSVCLLMHRFREAMYEPLVPFEGTTEIDEAKVNLPEGPLYLIGAYNHKTNRVYIEIIPKQADQEIMRDFVLRVTVPGSRIYTDGTAAYPKNLHDRSHYAVIHSWFEWARPEEVDGPNGEKVRIYITTNRIERSWGFLRQVLRGLGTLSRKHFSRYLLELQWRVNHLHNRKAAEAYTGAEPRNRYLMEWIVAQMGSQRITVPEIMDGKRARTESRLAPPMNQPIDGTVDNYDHLGEGELPLAA